MDIKEQDLFEYLKCPIRYRIAKNNGDTEIKKSPMKLASLALNQWLAAKSCGMKADANVLKSKWDRLAEKHKYELQPKKVLEMWGLLYSTYRYITNFNIEFSDINKPYVIEVPGTKIRLSGVLSPIIDKGSYYELLIVSFDKVLPDRVEADMKLKYTIDAYAIREIYNKDVVITFFSPAQGKTITTLRSPNDFKRLENILKNVGKAINEDIIYPSESYLCKTCSVRDLCKSWTGC